MFSRTLCLHTTISTILFQLNCKQSCNKNLEAINYLLSAITGIRIERKLHRVKKVQKLEVVVMEYLGQALKK